MGRSGRRWTLSGVRCLLTGLGPAALATAGNGDHLARSGSPGGELLRAPAAPCRSRHSDAPHGLRPASSKVSAPAARDPCPQPWPASDSSSSKNRPSGVPASCCSRISIASVGATSARRRGPWSRRARIWRSSLSQRLQSPRAWPSFRPHGRSRSGRLLVSLHHHRSSAFTPPAQERRDSTRRPSHGGAPVRGRSTCKPA